MNYKVNVSSGDGAPPQPPQSDVAYPIVDCRDYQGDNIRWRAGRVISLDTAQWALNAIKRCADRGDYAMLYADDLGGLAGAIEELERALK
jgi:hypothetical protein